MKLSSSAKKALQTCLGVPDGAAELAFLLIERAFVVYRESDMNPDFKPASTAEMERKINNLRAALSAVQKCYSSLQALDWVYCRERGETWTAADLPAIAGPDIRRIMMDINGRKPLVEPGEVQDIPVLKMVPRLLKTCELALKPVACWTGFTVGSDGQLQRDSAGRLMPLGIKTFRSAAAAVNMRQRGNPGLSSGEIGFAEYMVGLYEACGGVFSQQQNKGFDQFLRAVFSALDPTYPEEANHSALLRAVAAKRKRANLKTLKK